MPWKLIGVIVAFLGPLITVWIHGDSRANDLRDRIQQLQQAVADTQIGSVHSDLQKLDHRIDDVKQDLIHRIDVSNQDLTNRMEQMDIRLNHRIDELDAKFDRKYEGLNDKLFSSIKKKTALILSDPKNARKYLITAKRGFDRVASARLPGGNELVSLRQTVAAIPEVDPSARSVYWQFASALVNYPYVNNFLESQHGPVPKCPKLTNSQKDGGTIFNCEQSLDGNSFEDVSFVHVLVRYAGGPVKLHNVTFEGCHFEMDIKQAPTPKGRDFVRQLLTLDLSQAVIHYPG